MSEVEEATARKRGRRSDLSTRSGAIGAPASFHLTVSALPGRNDAERMRVLQRLLRAWAYIGADPVTGCDLRSLAHVSHYSYTHLQRTFKRVFGVSPHNLALAQRMRIARDLLCDTCLSITDIAGYAGYDDRASFARAFRKHFGTTPSDLRRKSRGKGRVEEPVGAGAESTGANRNATSREASLADASLHKAGPNDSTPYDAVAKDPSDATLIDPSAIDATLREAIAALQAIGRPSATPAPADG